MSALTRIPSPEGAGRIIIPLLFAVAVTVIGLIIYRELVIFLLEYVEGPLTIPTGGGWTASGGALSNGR